MKNFNIDKIAIIGIIATLLLIFNLGFSIYTLVKQNIAVQKDIDRIEIIEDRLLDIETYIDQSKKLEVK